MSWLRRRRRRYAWVGKEIGIGVQDGMVALAFREHEGSQQLTIQLAPHDAHATGLRLVQAAMQAEVGS